MHLRFSYRGGGMVSGLSGGLQPDGHARLQGAWDVLNPRGRMAIGCGHPRKPLTMPPSLLWIQRQPAARVMRPGTR